VKIRILSGVRLCRVVNSGNKGKSEMMKIPRSFDTSVIIHQSTRRNMREDNLQQYRYEKFKF